MPHLNLRGRDLFYIWRQGSQPKQSRTFLFAHGLGSSHAFFLPIIPHLVDSGYSCLAFDLPGSAQSSLAGDGLTIKEIADVARELVLALKIPFQDVVAVGHSMGSLIVSGLASREKLAGVVFIGPIYPSAALSKIFTERIDTVTKGGMEAMADSIPTAATGSQAGSLHHAFIRTLLLSQSSEGYISLCRAIAGADADAFRGITSPLLVIAGEDDRTANIESVRKILECASNTPSSTLEVILGTGHWHCIEAPDAVTAVLVEFGRNLSAASKASEAQRS